MTDFSHILKTGAYINGEWIHTDNTYGVYNPSSREAIAHVTFSGQAHTEAAIQSAEKALSAWQSKTAKERSQILYRWYELMMEHQNELAKLLVTEQGKPWAEGLGEVVYAASFIQWFAEEAKRIYGDVIPSHKKDARIVVIKQAIGVVAAITPWNFPLAMLTRKVGPALAAGCTVVIKPSEETPLSANALVHLAELAGVPPGVLNIVSGDYVAIGQELMSHPVVKKISFTGSTNTGKLLYRQGAETMKKLSLELGGNAAFIVFEDADLDAAVAGAMASKYRNTGQTCVCVNRFLVQDKVYDAFVDKLTQAVKKLVVGDAFTEGVTQGPLINQAALSKVQTHVADAVHKGALIQTGGALSQEGGTFYEPTVLSEATADMLMSQEETFGPIAACYRFSTEEQAIQLANDTPFGLSSYFYTKDLSRAWRVGEQLQCGMIGINEGMISTEVAPFGGMKESGLGREGSKYGIDEYVQIKYMLMGGI